MPTSCNFNGTVFWQIEKDKFYLFHVLMQVPITVVRHLSRSARSGYEKMRSQMSAGNGSDGGESEPGDDGSEGMLDVAGSFTEVRNDDSNC